MIRAELKHHVSSAIKIQLARASADLQRKKPDTISSKNANWLDKFVN